MIERIFGKLLIVLLMIFIYDSAVSQEENEYYYGLKAGINLSTLNGSQSSIVTGGNRLEPSSKISAVAGGFFLYKFSEGFGMQPELLFSMKGVNYDADEYVETWSLWYIEVPVLFKSIFDMQNNMIGSFFAGPALSYKIKSQWSDKMNNIYLHEDNELAGIANLDFSAVIGGSIDMELLGGRFGADLRYTYGLMSIQKNLSVQNGTISIALYYVFDFNNMEE